MVKNRRILVFSISAVFGFVISLGVSMAAWEPFENRSFRCTDQMGGIFWDSIAAHRAAGDTVSPGWTWDKITMVQTFYEAGFIALWLAIAAAPALVPRRKEPAQPT